MKTSKRCLSILLAVIMVLSVMSLPAMAEGEPAATTLTPTADAYMGDSWTLGINTTSTDVYTHKNYNGDSSYPGGYVGDVFGWRYIRVATFAYDINDVFETLDANPGYQIKSAKFKPYAKYWGSAVEDIKFYSINAQWDETSIASKTQNTIDEILPIDSAETNGPKFGTPDLTVASSYASRAGAGNTGSYVQDEYDITSLLRKHISNHGSDSLQNFFSFALEIVAESGNMEYIMQSRESGYGAALVVEYFLPEGLSLENYSLPVQAEDDVVLTYNNNIASATAKVNGASVGAQYITVENNTVTIDNGAFEQCNVLEVRAVDEYNFSTKSIYAFAVNNGLGDNNLLRVEYNSDSAAATVYYINKAYCNSPVTVSVVDSYNTEYYCSSDGLATDSAGVLVYNIPASISNDESYIVYVAHEDGTNLHVDIVNGAYTSFLWNLAARSTDAAAIKERFDIICSNFDLTVGYSDKIVNIDDFYDKLASLRASYPIGDKNAENEAKLKAAFEEIGLFTATEDISDSSASPDARELYDIMLAKIADRNFASKLAQVEAQCSSDGSPFFADVYNGFISSSKTINSYADFENMLKASYNSEKSAALLGEFSTMTHLSQVGAFLNNSETIDAFGIAALVDRYNALNSTSEVDNALYGKTFANNSAFTSALNSALTSAERVDPPAPQKPSSRPSKGGSAIVGAIGAPVDTTPIINNEKPSYSDLAGYDWAKEHIAALSAEGIINGKGNGEFDPAGKVLREESVKMIVEAFGITASGNAAFDDVNSDDWFRDFVLTAKNAGIVNGVSDTSFGAGLSITRQDAAVMLFTALSKKGLASAIAGSDSTFADDADIATYALDAVRYMNSVGAMTGYADGTFKPMSTITRAEFAVVLGRIYNTLK